MLAARPRPRPRGRALAVASACALALSALTAFGSGGPGALAASKYPTPATTVANVTHAQAGVLASYAGSTVTGVGWTRRASTARPLRLGPTRP